MNSVLKKVLPVVLLIWPYLFFIGFMIGQDNETLFSAFFLSYLVMTAVVYLMNIVNAWMYKDEDNCYRLAFFDMLIKLLHIPFYLLVFLIGVLMFMAMVVHGILHFLFVTDVISAICVFVKMSVVRRKEKSNLT